MDFTFLYPYIAAAALAFGWAWSRYRSDILDPSKPTPDKFVWQKAATSVVIALGVSIFFTASGKALDITGLDTQMGIVAGIATPYVQPIIMAVWRWAEEKIATLRALS